MSESINKSTEHDLMDESAEQNVLASRWKRLWASLLDGLIMTIITLPVMYFTGGVQALVQGAKPATAYSIMMGIFGLIVFILLNGKLLINNGQTIGKKILGIKITTLNGNLPKLKEHLLKRYAVFFIPGQIPFVGQIFAIINVLFVFGKQKRCIHDLVAGTRVVVS